MDENEKEIARILAEEAKQLDGGDSVPPQNVPDDFNADPYDVNDGVRPPDEARVQQLVGGHDDSPSMVGGSGFGGMLGNMMNGFMRGFSQANAGFSSGANQPPY